MEIKRILKGKIDLHVTGSKIPVVEAYIKNTLHWLITNPPLSNDKEIKAFLTEHISVDTLYSCTMLLFLITPLVMLKSLI